MFKNIYLILVSIFTCLFNISYADTRYEPDYKFDMCMENLDDENTEFKCQENRLNDWDKTLNFYYHVALDVCNKFDDKKQCQDNLKKSELGFIKMKDNFVKQYDLSDFSFDNKDTYVTQSLYEMTRSQALFLKDLIEHFADK